MKKLIVQISFVLLLIIFSIFLFNIGKGHTILLDNNTISGNSGKEYKSLSSLEISIDKNDEREMFKRDRLKEEVTGQGHKVTVTYLDKGVEKVIEKKFSLSLGEPMYLISIPLLLAEEEDWLQVFELQY